MQYRIGNSKYVRLSGETLEIVCPKCNKTGTFGVFSNSEVRLIPEFPLFDADIVYFAVCPNCAQVYALRGKSGKSFKKDKLSVGNFDLLELEQF